MKAQLITAAAAVAAIGLFAGCSTQTTPATNGLPTMSPIPETEATLVPDAGVGGAVGEGAAPAPEPESPPGIEEGVWLVGEDVAPGKYRTTFVVQGGCYWETTSPSGNIIDNDFVTGGRPTVTLRANTQFKTQGCGNWIKV